MYVTIKPSKLIATLFSYGFFNFISIRVLQLSHKNLLNNLLECSDIKLRNVTNNSLTPYLESGLELEPVFRFQIELAPLLEFKFRTNVDTRLKPKGSFFFK